MSLWNPLSWFGRARPPEIKGSRAAPSASSGPAGFGASGVVPRNYEGYATEAYSKNCVAYRCISIIAQSVAQLAWVAVLDDDELDTSDPIRVLLDHPNPYMGAGQFFEALAGYYLIAGNTYVEGVGPSATGISQPREMYTLRPDRITIELGRNGYPAAYTYRVGASQPTVYRVDPKTSESMLCHVAAFNPTDDLYGLSPVQAAAFSIDQHNSGGRWNNRLLQNSARPSGAIQHEDSANAMPLSEEQYNRLKRSIEESYSGPDAAGKTIILENGLKWQELSLSPKDMDWINGKDSSARDICQVFGVPAMLAHIPGDNTYANYHEARLALWEDRVLPFASLLGDALGRWLAPLFGYDKDALRIIPDADSIPALQEKRAASMQAIDQVTFLTVNEKREMVGWDAVDGGDVILVNGGMVPLGAEIPEEEAPPQPPPPPPVPSTEDEEDETEKHLRIARKNLDAVVDTGVTRIVRRRRVSTRPARR